MQADDPNGAPSKCKLALIGPVTPFRGGIAQYTTELRRALATRCDLQTISFRRQYPAFLYPGKSDREPGLERFREAGVDYRLDALNPLTWVSAARAVAARGNDLTVIDWWTLFWAPGLALIARMLRARGARTAFLCHNLFDHDSGVFKRAVSRRLLSQAAAYIVHSNEHAELLHHEFPGRPVLVHPLPTFDHFPPASNPQPQRGRLELLFFGFIRPYKGLDVLVDALAKLRDNDIHLTIVGEPWCPAEELRARIRATGAPNIELHLQYVDDVVAADFFARADLVVLPYRAATPSAVAALAYHYDRPVLATRVPGLRDVVEEGRTGFLVDPNSPEQLADRLRALTRAQLQQMRQSVGVYKSRFTWASLADAFVSFAGDVAQAASHRELRPGIS